VIVRVIRKADPAKLERIARILLDIIEHAGPPTRGKKTREKKSRTR
jgi:hypothetical protein